MAGKRGRESGKSMKSQREVWRTIIIQKNCQLTVKREILECESVCVVYVRMREQERESE